MGKPTIFAPKDGDQRYRINALTRKGQQLFEAARAKLKRLSKWRHQVSDADVVESLLRGDAETVRHLRHMEQSSLKGERS